MSKANLKTWKFFWEDEGYDGENSFFIQASDYIDAFNKAYENYGPQVESMFYKVHTENETEAQETVS